jgi:hypothetical protein
MQGVSFGTLSECVRHEDCLYGASTLTAKTCSTRSSVSTRRDSLYPRALSAPAPSPLQPPANETRERRDQVREALGRDLEAARYAADRAFRQYDAADPANRLVAGELEVRWNRALAQVAEVEGKIAAHDTAMPAAAVEPSSLGILASNLKAIWSAPTTDARLKKRIVRTLIHEVVVKAIPAA